MASAASDTPKTLIESLDQCAHWCRSGARPRDQFRIGTEYERFAIGPDGAPVGYHGHASIKTLLNRLVERHGWLPFVENGNPIALSRGGVSVSLEPAGQFELSGGTQPTIAATQAELEAHQREVQDVAQDLGIRLAWLGFNPHTPVDRAPQMPKDRYKIMRDWMPTVGGHGLHMMHLTCTVQANIDFSSEHECMEMMRAGHLLSPVIIGLFANSPWAEGKPSGYATFRAHLWTDVDNARCDVRKFAFDKSASIADYVQWAVDVPMYFVGIDKPDGSHGYQAMDGKFTFRQFFERGLDGRRATLADWELHVSTLFPDIRLKRWLEIRQADLVPPESIAALPALAKGWLYDVQARGEILDLLRDGDSKIDRAVLREEACRTALGARVGDVHVGQWAKEALAIARRGLQRLAEQSGTDHQAAQSLVALEEIAHGDKPAYWQRAAARLEQGATLADLATPWPV